RDECVKFSYNSRLDTIQAVVADHVLSTKLNHITESRIRNANYLDSSLKSISEIIIPNRESDIKQVYHLYSIRCEQRDSLKNYLIKNGVDAKIHYPVPMHLQSAAKAFGYQKGDFPVTEMICAQTLSLPVHEFITKENLDCMIDLIKKFYL
ncbi:MAG: DegT/DnrJ/EryC1/StrS family aminotransferase, partial [Gammaproteobacteria bacterium]|nr:DegT/DnrJ/EryC1/StrS family aminotransferase [Gammaproteobacteria bacterium]